MNWILDNLQLVVVAAGALAYWLNQRRQSAEADAENPGDAVPGGTRPDADAMEVDERTRRIQEEIRRKIMERSRQSGPPELEPEEPPIPARWREELPTEPVRQRAVEPPSLEQVVLAQQREMEEQMAVLAAERAAARARTRVVHFPGGAAAMAAAAAIIAERGIMAELRDPRSLRRAVVLREVLGPPVALR